MLLKSVSSDILKSFTIFELFFNNETIVFWLGRDQGLSLVPIKRIHAISTGKVLVKTQEDLVVF